MGRDLADRETRGDGGHLGVAAAHALGHFEAGAMGEALEVTGRRLFGLALSVAAEGCSRVDGVVAQGQAVTRGTGVREVAGSSAFVCEPEHAVLARQAASRAARVRRASPREARVIRHILRWSVTRAAGDGPRGPFGAERGARTARDHT